LDSSGLSSAADCGVAVWKARNDAFASGYALREQNREEKKKSLFRWVALEDGQSSCPKGFDIADTAKDCKTEDEDDKTGCVRFGMEDMNKFCTARGVVSRHQWVAFIRSLCSQGKPLKLCRAKANGSLKLVNMICRAFAAKTSEMDVVF